MAVSINWGGSSSGRPYDKGPFRGPYHIRAEFLDLPNKSQDVYSGSMDQDQDNGDARNHSL